MGGEGWSAVAVFATQKWISASPRRDILSYAGDLRIAVGLAFLSKTPFRLIPWRDQGTKVPPMLQLSFHGAAETVTGSKYLVRTEKAQVLVDCGLFQGLKELRLRNWNKPPFNHRELDALVLTHAHLDHVGYLPRLLMDGFRAPVYSTPATRELARLILLDSAFNQERDAEYANRKQFSKHHPALPLYTVHDAEASLKHFRDAEREVWTQAAEGIRFRFHEAGHLLGSCWLEMEVEHSGKTTRLAFSGDVGRYNAPYYHDPMPPLPCDFLICESTYGDRDHPQEDLLDSLEKVAKEALHRGGVMLFAAFAVGRTQQLIYLFQSLFNCKRLPVLPIFVDSPMAVDATLIYKNHPEDHQLGEACSVPGKGPFTGSHVQYARSVEESKRINEVKREAVIISSSGMMEGGRILHHLKQRLPHPENTVVFGGYMAPGTRGRDLQENRPFIRIHGGEVKVRAAKASVSGLSGHADRSELLRWTAPLPPPRGVFLTHGELAGSEALARTFRQDRAWNCFIPKMDESFDLENWT